MRLMFHLVYSDRLIDNHKKNEFNINRENVFFITNKIIEIFNDSNEQKSNKIEK